MESIARINRLFGSGGEVMISLYSNAPRQFDVQTPLFVRLGGLFVPLYLARFERRGAKGAIVLFEDIDTPRRISELLNLELFMQGNDGGSEDVSNDEFMLEDLVGFSATLSAVDSLVQLSGEITDFIDSPHNPLFEVVVDGVEHLIPAQEEMIAAIDFEAAHIDFILPQGLLELN